MKKLMGLLGMLGLALVLVPGCSNSTGPDDAEMESWSVWKANDAAVDDVSEIPTPEEVLGFDGLARGGSGWRDRFDGRRMRQLMRQSLYRCIRELELTEEQQELFKDCLTTHREAVAEAAEEFAEARSELFEELKSDLDEVRADLDAGTITEEDARARVQALTAEYRTDVAALAGEFREEVATSREALDDCVSAFLTDEQLDRWRAMRRW